jgi:hypothetical protein
LATKALIPVKALYCFSSIPVALKNVEFLSLDLNYLRENILEDVPQPSDGTSIKD